MRPYGALAHHSERFLSFPSFETSLAWQREVLVFCFSWNAVHAVHAGAVSRPLHASYALHGHLQGIYSGCNRRSRPSSSWTETLLIVAPCWKSTHDIVLRRQMRCSQCKRSNLALEMGGTSRSSLTTSYIALTRYQLS